MKSLQHYIEEQLSDVKSKWHPKDGLFTGNDPKKIVDYLLKNSKDQAQAMQRLCFYMNRAGSKLSNKTVLNKAKDMLKKSKNVNEKLMVNKDYVGYSEKKCMTIFIMAWEDNSVPPGDQITITVSDNCTVKDDKIIMNNNSSESPELERTDDCYFWHMKTGVMDLYVIGLTNVDGVDFLNNIRENIPNKINMHKYFKCAPNETYTFGYYDSNDKENHPYTKKEIDKLIKQLS